MTLIGCLDRNSNGDYLLTRVPTNRSQEASQYTLITSEDLSKHVANVSKSAASLSSTKTLGSFCNERRVRGRGQLALSLTS